MTDEQLLIGYRDTRRVDVFDELNRRYSSQLSHYLARRLGDASLADDVLQDTWLQVHLKCGLYEGGRSARAWLYAIANHRAIDVLRQAHRQATVSFSHSSENGKPIRGGNLIDQLPGEERDPLEELGEQEWRQSVREIVNWLPEELRQTLILTFYHGLKYHEVAAML